VIKTKITSGYDIASRTYWKLDNYLCRTINRDKEWFKRIKPELEKFWKDIENEREKKQTLQLIDIKSLPPLENYPNYYTYLTPKKIRNYIQNDTLLDWLFLYGSHKYSISNTVSEFNNYIAKRNKDIRKYIFNLIRQKINRNIDKNHSCSGSDINNNYNKYIYEFDHIDFSSTHKIHKIITDTVDILSLSPTSSHPPIILNPVLSSDCYKEKYSIDKIYTYDILIRGDYISKIFDVLPNGINDFKDITTKKSSDTFSPSNKYYIFKIMNLSMKINCESKNLVKNSSSKIKLKKAEAIFSCIPNMFGTLIDKINIKIENKYVFCISHKTILNKCNGKKNNTSDVMESVVGSDVCDDDDICITDPLYTFGVIELYCNDRFLTKKIIDADEWWCRLLDDGMNWSINPPTVSELYPNMNNKNNMDWYNTKNKIALEISDITEIWGCSINDRKILHNQGIYSWKDPSFNTNLLPYKRKKRDIINGIVYVNRSNKCHIKYNKYFFKNLIDKYNYIDTDNYNNDSLDNHECDNTRKSINFYIDFETVNNLGFDHANYCSDFDDNIINIIGVGYISNDGKWVFKSFIAMRLNLQEEKKIILNFVNYVNRVVSYEANCDVSGSDVTGGDNVKNIESRCNYRIYHWSQAEKILLKKALKRHMNDLSDLKIDYKNNLLISSYYNHNHNDSHNNINHNTTIKYKFVDLLDIFKETPIFIKGALNFSLKTISKALYDLGKINIKWEENTCTSGLESMYISWNIDQKIIKREICDREKNVAFFKQMGDVIKYNEIDCKVMWDIVGFLKELYNR